MSSYVTNCLDIYRLLVNPDVTQPVPTEECRGGFHYYRFFATLM
ncbi:hypothetical protein [Coleofasciculus sp. E1-EBD-02]